MKAVKNAGYKRILPILLLALVMLVLVPVQAQAATSGKCGENLTYTYDDGTLTISGTGPMADYSDDDPPWIEEEVYWLDINEGVTSIGEFAFSGMESLETVDMADTVTKIGFGAFRGCSNLQQIYLSENLEIIENMAFSKCAKLIWIEIPETLESLGAAAFMGCSSLESVNVPGSVGTIPINCFNGCTSLESMEIEEGITLIDEVAFAECTVLESVYIPKSVTTLGYCAFADCSALKEIHFSGFNCSIDDKAFEGVTAEAWYLVDPQTGDHVSLKNYGGTLTWINYCGQGHAFSPDYRNGEICLYCGYEKPSKISAPTLTISADTTTGKPKLSWKKIDGAQQYRIYRSTKKTSGFEYLKSTKTTYTYTDTTAETGVKYYYKVKAYASNSANNSDWSNVVECTAGIACGKNLTYTYENGILTIAGTGPMADYSAGDLRPWGYYPTKVIIKEGVTSVGDYAFAGSEELVEVILPDSLNSIGENAFRACESLKEIEITGSVSKIPNSCFYGCDGLEKVVIPKGVTVIDEFAFANCYSLEDVNIPEGVTSIGAWAFCRTDLSYVTLPESLITLGEGAFYECKNLDMVIFSQFNNQDLSYFLSNLTTIGSNAFYNCTDLESFSVTSKVNSIGEGAFGNCTGLERITFETSKCTIGKNAFEGVTANATYTVNPKTGEHVALQNYGGTINWVDACAMGHYFHDLYQDGKVCMYCDYEKPTNLPAPTLTISANTTTGKPKLRWNAVEGAVKYRIYRSTSRTGGYTYLKSTQTTTSYTDTTAEAGTNYYYKVKACHTDSAADSDWSNIVNRVCDLEKPLVTIAGNSENGKPVVYWGTVTGAAKYRVYRSESKSSGYELVYTGVTARSYTDKTADAGIHYYYKVKAIHTNSSADSAYSEVVGRTCDLAKPLVTISVSSTSGKPVVKWETVEGAAKYRVYRSESKSSGYEVVYTGVTARSYTDKTAEAGTKYYYRVKAVHSNFSADSAYSATVSYTCDLARPDVNISLRSGKPRLTWEQISGAEKYYIYRAMSKTGEYTKIKTTKTATSFTDTGAEAGTTYYYKVRAIHSNSAANSAYSAIDYIKAK